MIDILKNQSYYAYSTELPSISPFKKRHTLQNASELYPTTDAQIFRCELISTRDYRWVVVLSTGLYLATWSSNQPGHVLGW